MSQIKYLYPSKLVKKKTPVDWDEQKDPLVVDWKRVRNLMEHENYLIIERAKILLASQSLLSAAFYFAYSSVALERSGLQPGVLFAVASIGLVLALYIAVGMYTAKIQHKKLLEWWFSRVGYKRGMASLPDSMAAQPPICGRDPGSKKLMWSFPYCTVAILFVVLWISALALAFKYKSSSVDRIEFLGNSQLGEVQSALFRMQRTGDILLCHTSETDTISGDFDCSAVTLKLID